MNGDDFSCQKENMQDHGYNRKPKFKKSLWFVLFSLVILCIIFDFLVPATDTKSIASTNENNNTSVQETTTTPEPEPEPEIPKEVEPMEDENLKIYTRILFYYIENSKYKEKTLFYFYKKKQELLKKDRLNLLRKQMGQKGNRS